MLVRDLAEEILRPSGDAPRLHAVSGYASPSALLWCLSNGDPARMSTRNGVRVDERTPRIRVLIGMANSGGVTRSDHDLYRSLCKASQGHLSVHYPRGDWSIHSKVYLWSTEADLPLHAFSGSANFTNQGMNIGDMHQENVMHPVDPESAWEYIASCFSQSVDCLDAEVENIICFADGDIDGPVVPIPAERHTGDAPVPDTPGTSVNFYLYSRSRKQAFSPGGGINWGLRENRYNKDEAYLPITAPVSRSGFLPPLNTPFTVRCDDGTTLVLRGASGNPQQSPSGKDLTSIPSNARIGIYIRHRMGLPPGSFIGIPQILDYGRSFVTLTKLEDGDFFLDFSRPPSGVDMAFGGPDHP